MKIVFCGDSWCRYMPTWTGQVGLAGHLESILQKRVIDIGKPGATTEQSLSLKYRALLEKNLKNCDVLCVSSGGDSIAGEHAVLWLQDNVGQGWENATDTTMLSDALDLVVGCYNDICLLRDEIAPDCRIISHTYDVPSKQVLGKGLLCFGPWLKPSLDYCGWSDKDDQINIIRQWLFVLAMRIKTAAATQKNWTVIDTFNILKPNEWANELHPTQDGFKKIAQLFANEINTQSV